VREICRRLDGLPLALELAAAHVALLSPGELAARLSLALLSEGARDGPERHRALRATIDASYAPLDDDQRIAFARIATFAGPVTIDAALAVTGAELATLEALVDRQLLVRRDHRLGMLETIREYAAGRLAGDGDAEAAHLRHARYWMGHRRGGRPRIRRP
jgi:predicted ATPase